MTAHAMSVSVIDFQFFRPRTWCSLVALHMKARREGPLRLHLHAVLLLAVMQGCCWCPIRGRPHAAVCSQQSLQQTQQTQEQPAQRHQLQRLLLLRRMLCQLRPPLLHLTTLQTPW